MKASEDYRPIIAVASGSSVEAAFRKYGAEAFSIRDEKDEKAAIRFADGIAFTGGGDVAPTRYDDSKWHPNVYGVNKNRDEQEFRLVMAAKKRGIPMFGVCRGLQVLNVAHGGTLHQDIDEFSKTMSHWGGHRHQVHLRAGAGLTNALDKGSVLGTSFHHQSVDRIGDGLLPAGWANDGIIEIIESAPGVWPYVLATQFHPEMDHNQDTDAENIFKHFLSVCAEKAGRRKPTTARADAARKMRYPGTSKTTYNYNQHRAACPHNFRYNCPPSENAKVKCLFNMNTGYTGQSGMSLVPVRTYTKEEYHELPRCPHGFVYHKAGEFTGRDGTLYTACDFDGHKVQRMLDATKDSGQTYTEYEASVVSSLKRQGSEDDPRQEDDWPAERLARLQELLDDIKDDNTMCADPPCWDKQGCSPGDGDCLARVTQAGIHDRYLL